ncbi:LysR family transcriptional regulator [Dyella solisilvae]|uniref:LysR family transcriptional regulator n=1 Tax=Dyella solisilvae TaxID=1920168 RepID=A0A370K6E5_9GAMM|nr:LysR family transcriptional regulator [Dyella solisilvae]RDI98208.1 LysR family transcriptional regulator [Dyella solisilvae]
MRIDDASALRAFRLIARHGSFTRAAAELEVTPSALSQSLRQLESHLGVRLLHRTTRQVGLTEAGRAFLERISPALSDIDAAIEAMRQHGDRPVGTLRIAVPQMVLDLLIIPTLPDFMRAWPELKVDIHVENRLTDLIAEGFDAGIRLGERLARDVVAAPLGGRQRAVVVGSPSYFARRGRPQHPAELATHDCVRFRFSSGAIYRWEFAHPHGASQGQWFVVDVDGALTTNEPALAIRAAIEGLGLTHMVEPAVRSAVASGQLQTALDDWLPPFDGFYLYYPSRLQVPPKLRVFIEHLRRHIAEHSTW